MIDYLIIFATIMTLIALISLISVAILMTIDIYQDIKERRDK